MSEAENPHALPSRTTPTWEVELLISGVAVFSMLQLPGWLDDAMFALAPRLDATWGDVARLGYFYSKSAALILAVTFVLHLLLRARWIALVGMHSIYPEGVRPDRQAMGPLQREVEDKHDVSTETLIERADNLATTVFALGIMLAMVLVVVTLIAILLTGASTFIATAIGREDDAMWLFLAVFAVFLAPYALAVLLDRRYGMKWGVEHPASRAIAKTLAAYARLGLYSGNNRIRALLASNEGNRHFSILLFLTMALAIITVMFAYHGMRQDQPSGNYALFPSPASRTVDAAHYDDQRDPARAGLLPFVQSMVIDGAYLKLIVPYQPQRDAPALQQGCPGQRPSRDAALLACLQGLHAVSLDGKPLATLHYEIASDPRTHRPALLAMIDVRALSPGRHELRIARPVDRNAGSDRATPDADHDSIPFWR